MPAPHPATEAPRPRDREATTDKLLAAVGEVLARDGFTGIGVNAVARQAGVDKVLIYRYFGGLPGLIAAWGESGRFWPTLEEVLGPDPAAVRALPAGERLALFFERYVDALRARPLTIELLAAEIVERNELTGVLEAQRESWGEEVARLLGGAELVQHKAAGAVVPLLVGGVHYLLVRARKIRVFSGIDITADAGWDTLKQALRATATGLFDRP